MRTLNTTTLALAAALFNSIVVSVAEPLSFVHDVLPVLSKAGCNSGGCHGALAGKGGFRLSLNAYDPAADYYNITRHARGRRIEPANPGRSLFLTKPTSALKHKGGKILHEDSEAYRLLAAWIRGGAPGPSKDDPAVDRIEISPNHSILRKGQKKNLQVTAHFSDGTSRDVTRWALLTSTDESVAQVDKDTGEVEVIGYGGGAISAWYSSRIALSRIISPWPHEIPDLAYEDPAPRNVIDEKVNAQLKQLNLRPSPPSSDSEFLRRAFLDTIGVLPTPDETRAFLNDDDEEKRDKLVERLLQRPEFIDYWTYRWSDIFLVSGRNLRPEAVKAYYQWIRKQIEENTPWDEVARQVVTAKGDSLENGATNFYAVHQDPETMAENVSQAFMSLSINCAKCHNHPLEKWTNDQYYAFANLFSRVRAKGWGGAAGGDGRRTLFVESKGELLQPRTGKPQAPAPLDAEAVPPDAPTDRREALAAWLTSQENPYFTRAIANRVWAAFFGIGIVNPVDDLRASNPASNEALLQALSDHLNARDHDLKALMRLILRSNTYRRSSIALAANREDTRHFSRTYPRRLMAEVLHDAIATITAVPARFTKITGFDGSTQDTKFYEPGTRALQLYDSAVTSYFLKTFGRNDREITCECERSDKPSMVQVLHLSNGDTLNEKLRSEEGCVTALLEREADEILEHAYLLCLSRLPTESERERLRDLLAGAPQDEKRLYIEDLFWALMTSREFLFQH